MEGMDGVELARQIRNLSRKANSVIVTGSKPDQVRDKMAFTEVERWLFKPFGTSQLQELLGQIYPDDSNGR